VIQRVVLGLVQRHFTDCRYDNNYCGEKGAEYHVIYDDISLRVCRYLYAARFYYC